MLMRPIALLRLGLLGLAAGLSGCGSDPEVDPDQVRRVTLYALDPVPAPPADGDPSLASFRGYPVLGLVHVEQADRASVLIDAFNNGVARGGTVVDCFWPRHGLQVERIGGEVVDYVICFECLQFVSHRGESSASGTTDRSPQPVFDALLRSAGVPLAPPSGPG
ncbi:hypothetical protein [Tautonia plasticadhaerens]|uniref:Lipoprotein n=1 Tax=Tautonia plasticadhaerens TaxID=2527974 RepID=A0A518H1V0_9BACT|nr:hypothetical protein [Tautonia plasticadhaerens]QDV34829.1 hypothetical protein ElP_27260 [Tautonia plasticadhaerens]